MNDRPRLVSSDSSRSATTGLKGVAFARGMPLQRVQQSETGERLSIIIAQLLANSSHAPCRTTTTRERHVRSAGGDRQNDANGGWEVQRKPLHAREHPRFKALDAVNDQDDAALPRTALNGTHEFPTQLLLLVGHRHLTTSHQRPGKKTGVVITGAVGGERARGAPPVPCIATAHTTAHT